MEEYGAGGTPKEFYDAVSLHFHAAESLVYDNVHREMWQTLPRQFSLLIGDCLPVSQETLRVLDVGSGTGLSAQLFLDTTLGSRTAEMHLLDTSQEMLRQACVRARRWSVPVQTHLCSIFELPASEKFDIILVCSVLHHIADLVPFLNRISHLQNPGGLFIHLQDQNADFASDPEYLSRILELREARRMRIRNGPSPGMLGHLYQKIIWKIRNHNNYIAKTNKSLIRAGVIKRRMDEQDIWRVTDIRISPALNGISLREMRAFLPVYDLISSRTYAFFGEAGESLPDDFRAREDVSIERKAPNGHSIAAAWKKKAIQP